MSLSKEYPITSDRISNANQVLVRCAAHLIAMSELLREMPANKFPSKKWRNQYANDLRDLSRIAMSARMDPKD